MGKAQSDANRLRREYLRLMHRYHQGELKFETWISARRMVLREADFLGVLDLMISDQIKEHSHE